MFDIEAFHSFVSSDLVGKLGLEPEIVDRPLVVANSIGGSTSLCMICCNVVLSSHGCIFACDCLVALLVSSHVDCLNSEEMFLECLSDIGLGLWGLCLGNVEFD